METKHIRPEWIINYKKPVGTEIKFINGHWYLYERKSLWDSEKGKPRKKSGKLIGTITEAGLILKHERVKHEELACYELGASYFIYQVSEELRNKLVERYEKEGLLLYTISTLILKDNICLYNVADYYRASYLKILEGRLSFAIETIRVGIETVLSDSIFKNELNKITFNEFIEKQSKPQHIEDDKNFLEVSDDNYPFAIYYLSYLISIELKKYLIKKEISENYAEVIDLLKTFHVIRNNRKYIKTKPIKNVEKLIAKLDIKYEV